MNKKSRQSSCRRSLLSFATMNKKSRLSSCRRSSLSSAAMNKKSIQSSCRMPSLSSATMNKKSLQSQTADDDTNYQSRKAEENSIGKLHVQQQRRWENLNDDCLIQILEKVGLKALTKAVPFVCKSWYNASLCPQCWKRLDFDSICNDYEDLCYDKLKTRKQILLDLERKMDEKMKFVLNFSQGVATKIWLPLHCPSNALSYISTWCPNLIFLDIPEWCTIRIEKDVPKFIHKWKNLEGLSLGRQPEPQPCCFKEILTQINIHCKNFHTLGVNWSIEEKEAAAIVTYVPNIKHLILQGCDICRDSVKMILTHCKALEILDLSNCIGLKVDDNEIVQLMIWHRR